MELAQKPFAGLNRMLEIEEHVDIDVADMLSRAGHAGYSDEDAIAAILTAAKLQSIVGLGTANSSDRNARWM